MPETPRNADTPTSTGTGLSHVQAVHPDPGGHSDAQHTELIREWLCLSASAPEAPGQLMGLGTRLHLLPAELQLPVAEALAQRGMVLEALDVLRNLLKANRNARDEIRMAMARICVAHGDFPRACEELRAAAEVSKKPMILAFAAYLEIMAQSESTVVSSQPLPDHDHLGRAQRWSGQVLSNPSSKTTGSHLGDDAEVIALCVQSYFFIAGQDGSPAPAERLRLLLNTAQLTRVEAGYALLLFARQMVDQRCHSTAEQALDVAWELIIPYSSTRANLLSLVPDAPYPTSA